MQFRNFLNEVLRPEVDILLSAAAPASSPVLDFAISEPTVPPRRELLPQQTAMDAATTNTKDCHCRNSWLRGTPQRTKNISSGDWTCVLVQDLPTRTPSTWHHDVLNLSAGLAAMVGGRGTRTQPIVLSPRGTGDRQPSDPSRRLQPLDPPTHGFR